MACHTKKNCTCARWNSEICTFELLATVGLHVFINISTFSGQPFVHLFLVCFFYWSQQKMVIIEMCITLGCDVLAWVWGLIGAILYCLLGVTWNELLLEGLMIKTLSEQQKYSWNTSPGGQARFNFLTNIKIQASANDHFIAACSLHKMLMTRAWEL